MSYVPAHRMVGVWTASPPLVFPVVMYGCKELDHKESWVLKNWCSWTVVLEKTLERPLDCKEIKPVNPEGNESWIFIGRTDAEAPILCIPDEKSQLGGKDPDAGQDWGQEEKGVTEDEMAGSHHQIHQWTWVWVNSGSWWWTGGPGMLQSMGLQRVRHDWVTELKSSKEAGVKHKVRSDSYGAKESGGLIKH